MKKHNWQVEQIDGGHLGVSDFWKCHDCGASGGPTWAIRGNEGPPAWEPFLAGDGRRLKLPNPEDCDDVKQRIIAHKNTEDYQSRLISERRYYGEDLFQELKRFEVEGGFGKRGLVWGGIFSHEENGKRILKDRFKLEPGGDLWVLHLPDGTSFNVNHYNDTHEHLFKCYRKLYRSRKGLPPLD